MISNLSQVTAVTLPKVRDAASVVPSPEASDSVAAAAAKAPSDPAQAAAVNAAQKSSTEKQTLSDAIDKLNNKIQNLNRNLEFSIDKNSGELLVKVVDAQTHAVIRQIPSEEALALAENIDKYLQDHHTGLLKTKA